ncbi:unnamed protein product [Rhodiola kirilowii]
MYIFVFRHGTSGYSFSDFSVQVANLSFRGVYAIKIVSDDLEPDLLNKMRNDDCLVASRIE